MFSFSLAPRYCCCCELKTAAHTIAWIDVAGRTAVIITVAIFLNRLEFDSDLLKLFIGVFLGYMSVSLLANFLFITGIIKNKTSFLLPYLGLKFLEIIGIYLIIIIGSVIVSLIDRHVYLWIIMPIGIVLALVYGYLWLCMANYLKQLDAIMETSKEDVHLSTIHIETTK